MVDVGNNIRAHEKLFWKIVANTLLQVFEELDAAQKTDAYQDAILEMRGADPLLIYHYSPLDLARRISTAPEREVSDDQLTRYQELLAQYPGYGSRVGTHLN